MPAEGDAEAHIRIPFGTLIFKVLFNTLDLTEFVASVRYKHLLNLSMEEGKQGRLLALKAT